MAALLFVVTHSTEEPDRASNALATALAAREGGHEVTLWLSGEGVRLGVQGVAETLREPYARSAAEMVEALTAAGVEFLCDQPSFARREFEETALRTGARLVPTGELAACVARGLTPVPT